MLLTGWDCASGIKPPASPSSSVASTDIPLFFTSIFWLWLMSALSHPEEVFGTFQCLAVVLSYTLIFLSVYWNVCLCILSDRYFWLDGCHCSRFLVAGLRHVVLYFTVTLYRRLSFFAYCHLKSVNHCFLIFSIWVMLLIYTVCLYLLCVRSSQKEAEQEELQAGKAVHYTWTEPTGSRELCWKCGSYSGKLKSEEVPETQQHNSNLTHLVKVSPVFQH